MHGLASGLRGPASSPPGSALHDKSPEPGLESSLSTIGAELQRLDAVRNATAQQTLALQAYVQVQLALGAWQP